MRGKTLLSNPPEFATFELAHRMQEGTHRFEVSYGSSFNELYYDFSPAEFVRSADRKELELQLRRVGLARLVQVLPDLASGKAFLSAEDISAIVAGASL
ncbi:hypothetical protein [Methylophilus sp. DW102]|uniref:hypothetical protein n=1 Tax=Methylophilus sp. DW102 TaxID=3095607 RepID=UPI003084EFA9|nr:hypothetical protein MTDW_10540 [Methylophilus sp. DW102]